MAYLWLNLGLAVFFASFIIAQKRQFHILQLSSYRNDRYMSWVRKNYALEQSSLELFAPTAAVLSAKRMDWQFFVLILGFAILLPLMLKKRKEKKKFVYTARVKRLYAAQIFLFLIAMGVANLLYFFTYEITHLPLFLWIFALCMLYPARYMMTVAANTVIAPVERLIANHYIKDAKRILGEMPALDVIGITGSFGKTSTKYILSRILEEKYNTLMTPESFNTPMGVVRTIREKLSATHRFFVCEMGAKQKGDIKELCDIAAPKHCIITSVGNCHLESFKTLQNICDTKFELYDNTEGIAVLNFDSVPVREREKARGCISYGTTDDCDYYVSDIATTHRGMSFKLHTKDGRVLELTTRLLGRVNALNIAGACAMAIELGQDSESISFAVSRLAPVPHRLELKGVGSELVIDDAYNSNPAGAEQALLVLKEFEGMKRILVTPGIVELGEREAECNITLGAQAADCADAVIAVSHLACYIKEGLQAAGFDMDNYYYAENFAAAQGLLRDLKKGGAVVLYENDLPDNMENT